MLTIGQTIPEMEFEIFQNEEFKKVKFSEYKGKWLILLFYPADFTFVCPTELSEAADHFEEFKKLSAEIISVSCDTKYVHKAWHDESLLIKKIQFAMAADPTSIICKTFGTYIENEGLSLRATFIIDPYGIIKAIDMHDNSIGRSTQEILRKLQASIYVSQHDGEVCPASWHPGEKTLKTGIDQVGKL